MNERERVRERIERVIYSVHGPCCNGSERQCTELADRILSLTEMAVLADDQSLPEMSKEIGSAIHPKKDTFQIAEKVRELEVLVFVAAQQDMLKAGWRRVV